LVTQGKRGTLLCVLTFIILKNKIKVKTIPILLSFFALKQNASSGQAMCSASRVDRMSGSPPPPLSSPLTHNELEPPLAAEMWGLLRAVATQFHVIMDPAASSSSSSAATEPSPAQDSRRKDKAPGSPEDSKDEDEDISKSAPGGKSLSLAQGSDAPLYNVGLLDPRAESLSDAYEDIVRAVRKVSIGTHCSFPPNNNMGFSKEDLLHISALRKQFKALRTVLQLCVGLAEDGRVSANIYSVIVTILYTMRLQLDAQDDIYIKRRYG